MFLTKVVECIKTHVLCSITCCRKSCRLWDNVEKSSKAGETTNDNMAHALCMPDKESCRNAIGILNTNCLTTATIVPRTRLNAMFTRAFPSFFIFHKSITLKSHVTSSIISAREVCVPFASEVRIPPRLVADCRKLNRMRLKCPAMAWLSFQVSSKCVSGLKSLHRGPCTDSHKDNTIILCRFHFSL